MSRSLLVAVVVLVAAPVARADRHPSVLDSQPFAAGPLPGSPAIVIKTKGSDARCGGVLLTATVKKSKKASAPDKDLKLVFTAAYPTGLDFDPNNEAKRKKSMKRFDDWYTVLESATRNAAVRYKGILADHNKSAGDRIAASARMVQVSRWAAHVVARAEVPKNVRTTPEAKDIFCQTVAEKAEALEMFAVDAAVECRDLAATLKVGAGWWDDVCAP
jgi:hypothetical protein